MADVRDLTIVSGGQTGVDRAALDVALKSGLRTAGFVPKGRMTEDGPLPAKYTGLVEADSADTAERTKLNVLHSDATLFITRGSPIGGTRLAMDTARLHGKPALHIDLEKRSVTEAANEIRKWLASKKISRLNVAGPRASEDAEIYRLAFQILNEIFR